MSTLTAPSDRLKDLLEMVAHEKRRCIFCHAQLYFVKVRSGATMPYTVAGVNHFLDCPSFRKQPDPRQQTLLENATPPREAFD